MQNKNKKQNLATLLQQYCRAPEGLQADWCLVFYDHSKVTLQMNNAGVVCRSTSKNAGRS